MTNRVEASQRRTDTRQWVADRRERTRHLIELGRLVQKAGLVELTDDDRAVLFGAFLFLAGELQSERREFSITLWHSRGKCGFDAVDLPKGNAVRSVDNDGNEEPKNPDSP